MDHVKDPASNDARGESDNPRRLRGRVRATAAFAHVRATRPWWMGEPVLAGAGRDLWHALRRLRDAPAEFELLFQIAAEEDPIDDPTAIWPEERELLVAGPALGVGGRRRDEVADAPVVQGTQGEPLRRRVALADEGGGESDDQRREPATAMRRAGLESWVAHDGTMPARSGKLEGGRREWDRTTDPHHVKVVLYR